MRPPTKYIHAQIQNTICHSFCVCFFYRIRKIKSHRFTLKRNIQTKFTCGVNKPATYGLRMPGIVAIVFEMPNKMPEYGPAMSFTVQKNSLTYCGNYFNLFSF